MSELLRVENLVKDFQVRRGLLSVRGVVHAVRDVSFSMKEGEILSIIGETGSGKTTLAKIIVGLYPPTTGKIYFEGKEFTALRGKEYVNSRRKMQMIFQQAYASMNPRKSIYEIVSQPLRVASDLSEDAIREKVSDLLRAVDLNPPEEFFDRYPHLISGGQIQRIALTRALSVSPKFLVADEPVSELDMSIRSKVLSLLLKLRKLFSLTMLVITHDLDVAKIISDRIGVMYLGRIVEIGHAQQIVSNAQHPYTRALLASSPVMDPSVARRPRSGPKLEGEIPSPMFLPSGCELASRCPFKKQVCLEKRQELIQVEQGHFVSCHVVAAFGTLARFKRGSAELVD